MQTWSLNASSFLHRLFLLDYLFFWKVDKSRWARENVPGSSPRGSSQSSLWRRIWSQWLCANCVSSRLKLAKSFWVSFYFVKNHVGKTRKEISNLTNLSGGMVNGHFFFWKFGDPWPFGLHEEAHTCWAALCSKNRVFLRLNANPLEVSASFTRLKRPCTNAHPSSWNGSDQGI